MNYYEWFFFLNCLTGIYLLEVIYPYIYVTNNPKDKIQTNPWIHSIISSYFANHLMWNHPSIFFHLYNYNENDLTALESGYMYASLYSMAFGFYDFYNGFFKYSGWDYRIHGTIFLLVSLFLLFYPYKHYIYSGLMMETSSIFLNLIHIPHNNASLREKIRMCFFIVFLIYRWGIFSPLAYNFIYDNQEYIKEGLPEYFIMTLLILSISCLNIYWGTRLITIAFHYKRG